MGQKVLCGGKKNLRMVKFREKDEGKVNVQVVFENPNSKPKLRAKF